MTTVHIHVDERACLEVLIVRGRSREVRALADRITAIKGIRNGELVVTRT
jgi:CopG family nickel-responsive transcriptional regulator